MFFPALLSLIQSVPSQVHQEATQNTLVSSGNAIIAFALGNARSGFLTSAFDDLSIFYSLSGTNTQTFTHAPSSVTATNG